jgi:hypothetical protein
MRSTALPRPWYEATVRATSNGVSANASLQKEFKEGKRETA